MQLELAVQRDPGAPPAPRVLALHLPQLGLQRLLRLRVERAGPHRPLALLDAERGVVLACDPEARGRGVAPGDRVAQARATCPELELAPADPGADLAVLRGLAEALLALVPAVEVSAPDALLLDASGAVLLARTPEAAALRPRGQGAPTKDPRPARPDGRLGVAQRPGGMARATACPQPARGLPGEDLLVERALRLLADLGWRARAAVADGRGPARALARHGFEPGEAGPPVTPIAPHGASGAALAGLPISALDLPSELAGRLGALGLRIVADLARLPGETLAHRFGASGVAAWRLARGDDPSPLVPHVPDTLPEERLDPGWPVESVEPLLFGLRRLCEGLAARLAGRGLGATRLALTLALDPSGQERLDIGLATPTSASARWVLVVRERLAALRLPAPVVAVMLAVVAAAPAATEQLALDDRPERLDALETVLARLSARLGTDALFTPEPVSRHRPEAAYRAVAPRPGAAVAPRTGGGQERGAELRAAGSSRAGAHVTTKALASAGRSAAAARREAAAKAPITRAEPPAAPAAALDRPTRLLPRPQPLLALGEGGRLTAVGTGGRTLRVLALSPAERLAGEWWSDPFDRDYHRARLEGLGDCWIFRDTRDGRLWLHGFFD